MRIRQGYILKEVADEYFAIPFEAAYENQGAMISLNRTGAFLWQLLEDECTKESLCDALAQEYRVAPEVADEAVSAFLEMLRDKQLLLENA